MNKKYLAWKDPSCNGVNPQWIELSGKEFYSLMKQPENRHRRFIRFGNEDCPEADIIVLETTEKEYKKWRKTFDRSYYLSKVASEYKVLSMEQPLSEQTSLSLHEVIADKSVNIEAEILHKEDLKLIVKLLDTLTELEKQAILMAFFEMPDKADSEICRIKGIKRTTFSDRKNRALAKLKKIYFSTRQN